MLWTRYLVIGFSSRAWSRQNVCQPSRAHSRHWQLFRRENTPTSVFTTALASTGQPAQASTCRLCVNNKVVVISHYSATYNGTWLEKDTDNAQAISKWERTYWLFRTLRPHPLVDRWYGTLHMCMIQERQWKKTKTLCFSVLHLCHVIHSSPAPSVRQIWRKGRLINPPVHECALASNIYYVALRCQQCRTIYRWHERTGF